MDRAGNRHARIKFDLTECAFVSGDVLLQDGEQSFGLLRAEINPLKILNFDLIFGLLLQRAENEEEIPDVDAHLDAVGVGLAVLGSVDQLDIGLSWDCHTTISVKRIGESDNAVAWLGYNLRNVGGSFMGVKWLTILSDGLLLLGLIVIGSGWQGTANLTGAFPFHASSVQLTGGATGTRVLLGVPCLFFGLALMMVSLIWNLVEVLSAERLKSARRAARV